MRVEGEAENNKQVETESLNGFLGSFVHQVGADGTVLRADADGDPLWLSHALSACYTGGMPKFDKTWLPDKVGGGVVSYLVGFLLDPSRLSWVVLTSCAGVAVSVYAWIDGLPWLARIALVVFVVCGLGSLLLGCRMVWLRLKSAKSTSELNESGEPVELSTVSNKTTLSLPWVVTVVLIGTVAVGGLSYIAGKYSGVQFNRQKTIEPNATKSTDLNSDRNDHSKNKVKEPKVIALTPAPAKTQPRNAMDSAPPKPSVGTKAGPVTVQPGGVASFGQQGGITAGKIEINPLPAERTWNLSIAKCDDWVRKLDVFGPTDVSVGAFISNNDGNRVASILDACFKRSGWKSSMAVLPANPRGVLVGAARNDEKLAAVIAGLDSIGLVVTTRDIRPTYGSEIGIIIGTDPIRVNDRQKTTFSGDR